MNDSLVQPIEAARQRLETLQQHVGESPQPTTLMMQTLQELASVLEELRMADEELRQQNDELTRRVQGQAAELIRVNQVWQAGIAERQQIEDALGKSEAHFRAIVENSHDGMIMLAADRRVMYVSPSYERISGFSPEEWMGQYGPDFVHPDDQATTASVFRDLVQQPGAVTSVEYRLRHKLGHWFWVETTATNLLNDPRVQAVVLNSHDITERKQAEQALRESEQTAHRMTRQLQMVNQIGLKIAAGLDFEPLMQTLYEQCQQIGDTDTFYIALYDEATGQLSFPVNYKDGERRVFASRSIRDDAGLAGYIIEHRQTLYLPDSFNMPPGLSLIRQPGVPTRSFIGVPLFLNDRIVGVLSMQSHAPHAYKPGQISTLEMLATQVAIAIQNSRLYEQVQSERNLADTLVDNMPGAVCLVNAQGTLLRWNKQAEKMWGYALAETTGLTLQMLFAGEEQARITRMLAQVLADGEASVETRVLTKSGELRNIHGRAKVFDAGGRTLFYIVFQDITRRKQAEEALQQSRALYKSLVEVMPLSLCRKDSEGRFTFANSRFCTEANKSLDDIVGKTDFDLHPLELAEKYRRDDRQVIETGQMIERVEERSLLDGAKSYVQVLKSPVRDLSSNIIGVQIIFWDITERKRMEEALRASEERFALAIQAADEGVWDWNVMTNDLFCSPRWKSILGYRDDELENKWDTWNALVDPEDGKRAMQEYEQYLAQYRGPFQFSVEFKMRHKNGSYRHILSHGSVLRDDQGRPVRVVGTHLDLTERKQMEDELRQYADQLAAQNADLDAFAHTVAHDLKNPIGIIVGYAGLLASDYATMLPDDVNDSLRRILRAGNKLNTIIDELMLLAGIRKQAIVPEPLDMGEIVGEAVERLDVLVREHNARIILPDEMAWPAALGYAPWVEEVWANYISNAIKYGGQPPQITVGADLFCLQNPAGQAMVRFWVQDNGPGVSVEAQASLFTPFTRLAQTRATGHGLGLSIVRRIVEKLGGEVSVESDGTSGRGSTFFFTLPASK